MECNKDEAKRAMDIAKKKLSKKDCVGAKKFVTKAQNLYPHLDGLKQVSTMIHVYVSAANKINGGKDPDLYGVLGVDPLADDEALKKQYKKLALLLHPDKNKFRGAEGAFKMVLHVWTLLSDKAKRAAYDRRMKLNTRTQKPPSPSQHNKPPGSSNVYQNAKARSETQRPTNAPKPASSIANQNARYDVNPNGKATSNQPASRPQRPPPYAPKPNYSNVNQRDGYGVHPNAKATSNQPASGPQRPPPYAPKPASSSSGNPNVSRHGVHPSANHPASGPHKPLNPHKPASSNVNQNAGFGVDPNAKATSNKAAPSPAPTYTPGPVPAPTPGPAPAPTCAHGPAPGPMAVNSSKQKFWTVCNGCKTRSECRKDLYLNKIIRCQNCGQSYTATEKNPWDHYVLRLNKALSMIRLRQWSSSAHQNQATNKNTNGASSSGATKKNHPWESHVSQINYTLSLVVLLQSQWSARNQASNTNEGSTSGTSSSSTFVGATPQEKFALQQVFSTFSSILQLQQQWSAAKNNVTPSVSATTRKGPRESVVRPSNLSSSSPQQKQQQQWGAQNTSGGTYNPSSSSTRGSSPNVNAAMKTPLGSFVSPGVNHSSSPQQQQKQCGAKNTSTDGTYYPSSSSGSFQQKCSVSVPASSSSGNAANQAQGRSKRGLEDSQDTLAAIESVFKKLRKDVV